jgi:hypothetical protein
VAASRSSAGWTPRRSVLRSRKGGIPRGDGTATPAPHIVIRVRFVADGLSRSRGATLLPRVSAVCSRVRQVAVQPSGVACNVER